MSSTNVVPLRAVSRKQDDIQSTAERDYIESMRSHYQAHAEGTNVSTKTLLANDYLNHFNNVVMLLPSLKDCPDFKDDILAWAPVDYKSHFESSNLRDRDIAMIGYDYSPVAIRYAFDEKIEQLNDQMVHMLGKVRTSMDENDLSQLDEICEDHLPLLHSLIAEASFIANNGLEAGDNVTSLFNNDVHGQGGASDGEQ